MHLLSDVPWDGGVLECRARAPDPGAEGSPSDDKVPRGSWHRRIRDGDREGRGREGEGVAQEGVVLGGHPVADRRDQGARPRPAGGRVGGGWQPSGIAT